MPLRPNLGLQSCSVGGGDTVVRSVGLAFEPSHTCAAALVDHGALVLDDRSTGWYYKVRGRLLRRLSCI